MQIKVAISTLSLRNFLTDGESGYQVGFSKLSSSGRADHVAFADVADAKQFLAVSIQNLSATMPGQVAPVYLIMNNIVHELLNI